MDKSRENSHTCNVVMLCIDMTLTHSKALHVCRCALKEEKLKEEHKAIHTAKRQEEEDNRRAVEERKEKSSTAFDSWKNRKESTDLQRKSRTPSPDVRIAWSPAGIGRGGLLRSQASKLYPKSPSPKSHNPSRARKRKTIQVCCQTLEYWCVCDDGD